MTILDLVMCLGGRQRVIILVTLATINHIQKLWKSSIVKELGMRPLSFLITNASSSSLVEYIHRLESEIIEQKEARVRVQEAQAKQEEVQKNILNFLRSKGYDDTITYGGGLSSSYKTYWLVFYLSNWATLHGVTTFNALFETNYITLNLKMYICFLQLIY